MFGTFVQFLGYSFVGAIGTVVHYVVLVAGVDGLGLTPVAATSIGAFCGAVINYLLNHRFTFRSRKSHRDASVTFFWVAAAGVVVNGLVVGECLRAGAMHYLAAQMLATALVLVLGYIANRRWTFKEH
jgi:putative flippase GtrA